MTAFRAFCDEINAKHRPPGRDTLDVDGLLRDGWSYRDLPCKLSFEMWDLFISILGDAPYLILAASEGKDWRRGQFLLSPAAMAKFREYSASRKPAA